MTTSYLEMGGGHDEPLNSIGEVLFLEQSKKSTIQCRICTRSLLHFFEKLKVKCHKTDLFMAWLPR